MSDCPVGQSHLGSRGGMPAHLQPQPVPHKVPLYYDDISRCLLPIPKVLGASALMAGIFWKRASLPPPPGHCWLRGRGQGLPGLLPVPLGQEEGCSPGSLWGFPASSPIPVSAKKGEGAASAAFQLLCS